MLKRFFSVVVIVLMAVVTYAQDYKSLSEIIPTLNEGCVKSEYVMTVKGNKTPKITYEGILYWQDGAFRIEGDGYEIYCDKVHIWTVDSVSKEIVREEAVPIDDLIPATGSGKDSDKKEIDVVTTSDGKKISEISLTMKNGTAVSIAVPSMTFVESKSSDFFSYNESSIPEEFVFTQLD